MRLFSTMSDAILEIRRDLFKSPVLTSSRVQNRVGHRTVREAIGYTYSVPSIEIPDDERMLVTLGSKYFPYWAAHSEAITQWLTAQRQDRLQPYQHQASLTDLLHPELVDFTEGSHYSYTYEERLMGMWETMERALTMNPDTRRAYWPIYQPNDAVRAAAMTRIPCSLGYHFLIRQQSVVSPKLHLVYLQRSANFQIFWLSDLWFASQILQEMTHRLQKVLPELLPGVVTHTITSLHSFFDEEAEIY